MPRTHLVAQQMVNALKTEEKEVRAPLKPRAAEKPSQRAGRGTWSRARSLKLWPRKHLGQGSRPQPSRRWEKGAHAGLGSPRAARTFFRSLTWPVMMATTYILMTSSVLQSRKAGSTRPLISSRPGGGISAVAAAAAAPGETASGCELGRVALSPRAGRGGESTREACLHSAPAHLPAACDFCPQMLGEAESRGGGLPIGPPAPPHPSLANP